MTGAYRRALRACSVAFLLYQGFAFAGDDKPPVGSLDINEGGASTMRSDIQVGLTASDNLAVTHYWLSESAVPPAVSEFLPLDNPGSAIAESVPFELSPDLGPKTLSGWFADEAGNISARTEYALLYFDSEPSREWSVLDGTGLDDAGTGLAIGSSGDVFVAGQQGQFLLGGGDQGYIGRFSPAGVRKWKSVIGVFGSGQTILIDIAVDPSEQSCVTGFDLTEVQGNDTFYEAPVVCYEPDGALRWGTSLGPQGENVRGNGIAIGPEGNVYVAGSANDGFQGETGFGRRDGFITKLNSAGVPQWTQMFGTAENEGLADVLIDNNYLYLLGTMRDEWDGQPIQGFADYLVIKMTLDGVIEWSRLYGDDSTEDPRGFVAGPRGIYIVGETINEGTFISSIDRDGEIRWERDFARLDINDIGIDVLENLYIVGRDINETDGVANVGSFDVIVTKYDAEGTRLLSMAFGTEDAERGMAVAGDQLGHIYVTGYSTGDLDGQTNLGGWDLFLSKLQLLDLPPRPDFIFDGTFELQQ